MRAKILQAGGNIQAAKDIKDLITNSNGKVQEGVGLVNKAGAALGEIVSTIKEVADIVAGIAAASVEQSSGIEQINKAISQMDEATQQNSALVEQNAATAKALEQQATTMDQRVAFFRIDHGVAYTAADHAAAETASAAMPKPVESGRAEGAGRSPSAANRWGFSRGRGRGPATAAAR